MKFLLIIIIILQLLVIINFSSIKNLPVIKNAGDLSDYVGKKVIVLGKISDIQWQHTINYIKTHPVILYFDMDDTQIVIYSKKEINSKEQLKISGKVIKVIWKSEKAGDESEFAEYHIIADNYEIIK